MATTIRSALHARLSFVWAGFSATTREEIDDVCAEVARLFVALVEQTNGLRAACARSEAATDHAVVGAALHQAATLRLQDRIYGWTFVGADVVRSRLDNVLCEIADHAGDWLREVVR